ncbi:hypothetical protein AWV80_16915 [Cupriavidus sp. UYMU48A]|nr:hypothetical protein AWV80_16915 [Cupriavidus sp. UYMU48A]
MQWINRFRRYCDALGLDEADELTREGVLGELVCRALDRENKASRESGKLCQRPEGEKVPSRYFLAGD